MSFLLLISILMRKCQYFSYIVRAARLHKKIVNGGNGEKGNPHYLGQCQPLVTSVEN